ERKGVAATPAVVELTPERRGELERVQSDVNRRITAVEDIDQYGWREHWTYPDTGAGDCEDYALEKRRQLIAGGWPAQALFLAVARIPRGVAHTVLVAATSEGDFVLDNLMSAVMPWRRLPYAWKIRQSGAAPARWYLIPRG
ncbi:MAG: transglutaminase-like cysteine peptidase, partial [Proteobacteria bacterium]|nr:transglutaminase-like cysteine peptidase [Pseudomonadota bacterium]